MSWAMARSDACEETFAPFKGSRWQNRLKRTAPSKYLGKNSYTEARYICIHHVMLRARQLLWQRRRGVMAGM